MFTGIVEEGGTIQALERRAKLQRTSIQAKTVLDGTAVGDSISIDGACHTAVEVGSDHFVVESVGETLIRTTMGDLATGDPVNLERSVRLADRLDGHLVQGHVDGIGTVVSRDAFEDNINFTFEVDGGVARYIAEKGSVAIDGISLTVVAVEDVGYRGRFSVTLVPHTLSVTMMGDRQVDDRVNVEVDVIARYLERLIQAGSAPSSGMTWDTIRELGYER